MSLFKVLVSELVPLKSMYHVDIPSDDFNEGMVIERLVKGQKVSQIQSDYDSTIPKIAGQIKVIAFFPVDIKMVRAEARSARTMIKVIKAEKTQEDRTDRKAEQKTTLKDKK